MIRMAANEISIKVDSRIIIDTYAWNRFNPNDRVSVSALRNSRGATAEACDTDAYYFDEEDDDDVCYLHYYSEYESDDGESRSCDKKETDEIATALTKEQLLLCGATLKGYSLKNKKWRKLTRLNRS